MSTLTTGQKGEHIAQEFLENKSYHILAKNYKRSFCEIDIIAQKRKTIIFVEVKTRIGEEFGTPEDALTHQKKRKLLLGARLYIGCAPQRVAYRIDAICIVLDTKGRAKRLTHHKDIVHDH